MKKPCRKSGKIKYESHEQALTRGGELLTNLPIGMKNIKSFRTYKCEFCNKFHLTSEKIKLKNIKLLSV